MVRLLPLLVLAGCSSYLGSAKTVDPAELGEGWLLARDVPQLLQKSEEDCGAAALAMVLSHWGLPCATEEVARELPPEPGRGIKAGALRDFARRKGLSAFLIHGTFDDLRKELAQGRPLIVGLIKPHVQGGLTHFEVVVGLHPERRDVLTIDPARGWTSNSFDGFLAEWDPAKRLTLVFLKPGVSG